MKIELKYDGKNYIDPLFTFLWNNENNNFGIGIRYNLKRDYNFIIQDLLENYEKFKINGSIFYYYTKENVYVFDLDDCIKLIPINNKFYHCIVLLDENGKVIQKEYKAFECIRYDNNY